MPNNSPCLTRVSAWLRLLHTPGLGPVTVQKLLRFFPDPVTLWEAAFRTWPEALPGTLQHALQVARQNPLLDTQITADLDWWHASPLHHIVTPDHREYPPNWRLLHNPPVAAFAIGHLPCLKHPQIALVGSRHPSASGIRHARSFAAELVQNGMTITSGLAQGIDGAAHAGALGAKGYTVGVLGTGIDITYPKHHAKLTQAIVANKGLLVSEFPRQTPPKPVHFPQRNRLISGLAWGVLVVEAALKSGSLITARYALDQNREVFALPAALENTAGRGGLLLIQQGAKLVTCVEEILAECPAALAIPPPEHATKAPAYAEEKPEPGPYDWLLACLTVDYIPVDLLIRSTGQSADRVLQALTALELADKIRLSAKGVCRT